MADELTPGDETVPLELGPLESGLLERDGFGDPDATVVIEDEANLWEPGPRLAARAPAAAATQTSRRGGSGWFIAALIVATAVVIALGLWWLASTSADDDTAAQALEQLLLLAH